MDTSKELVIGLTGLLGAGKGEVARFFVSKGFNYYSHSDELREILRGEGRELTRDNLFRLGNELREKYGSGYITQLIREKITRPAVVDSIRNPGEVEELRKEKHFLLISVEAPLEVRYRRVVGRTREGEEQLSLEEFRQKEERELQGSETSQQLAKVISMADFVVDNRSTLDALHERLSELYKRMTSSI